ncbi:MAG: plasmid pRiA4b ORF-3 family protein [Magnetospirillum sp.]|nr:plasmid pRiA4b ORF-3 family protein [Magnetospirillum sp.]
MVARRKSSSSKSGALHLKIELLDIEPSIWRRIVVPDSLSLLELHAVIQGAMGWRDCHLHLFEIGDRRFEVPEDGQSEPEEGCEDERRYRLKAVLGKTSEFFYTYDFGDDWRHRVSIEADVPPIPERYLPFCVGGERACPPEDCGGAYSYPDFLDALAGPGHSEHQAMREWAPGFEAEAFNVTQANALIQLVCALYRERGWGFDD